MIFHFFTFLIFFTDEVSTDFNIILTSTI